MSRFVGLDLGSYSIKVVRAEARRGADFEVLSYDEEVLPPTSEGVSLRDRQKAALLSLKEKGRLEGDIFVTGLVGDVATLRTLSFPFSDPRKIEQSLPYQLEAEIPFDLDDVVYAWSLLGPKRVTVRADDDGEKPKKSTDTDVMVCSARRETVTDLLALLEEVGIDPRHIELDALALDDLYDGVFRDAHEASEAQATPRTPGGTVIETGPDGAEPAVAMVDIGHRRTAVCIIAGERVISAGAILHGGFDATRALSREIGISIDDAERGKRKEAFIEVMGAKAQFPEQRRISDVLKTAYQPIVKRLRQTFQAAMGDPRVRVTKVIVTGGGSRVLNLERYLAEELNIRVERGRDLATRLGAALPIAADAEARAVLGDVPEAACALAYALSGMYAGKTRARIDFRTGDFAWKGDFDFVRERTTALGIWLAVVLVVLGVSSGARAFMLSGQESALVDQQLAACKAITGREIESSQQCLAIIQERITGQAGFTIPEDSATDQYMELARRLPLKDVLFRKVNDLEITEDRIRIKGVTTDYDAVDKIVAALSDGRCFSQVEKGKARNVKEQIEFNVSLKLDCVANPGKEIVADTSAMQGPSSTRPVRSVGADTDGDDTAGLPGRKSPEDRKADREERIKKARERLGKTKDGDGLMPPALGPMGKTKGPMDRDEILRRADDARETRESLIEKRKEKLDQIRGQKDTVDRLNRSRSPEDGPLGPPGRDLDRLRPMPSEGGRRPLPIPTKPGARTEKEE